MRTRGSRLRTGLLVTAVVGIIVFALANTEHIISVFAAWPAQLDLFWIGVAMVLVLLGNVARAVRTKTVLDQARPGKLHHHLDALSVGVLFNILLPFRAGEIARAGVLSRRLRISLLYTATAISIERLLDVAVVAGALLMFGAFAGLSFDALGAAVPMLVFVTAVIVLFVLFVRENRVLMRLVFALTGFLADGPRARLRMSSWSLIHGYQALLRSPAQLLRYAVAFVLSWSGYLLAVYIILERVFASSAVRPVGAGVFAPFVFPETLFGLPFLSDYGIELGLHLTAVGAITDPIWLLSLAFVIWTVLNLPTALYGVVRLFSRSFFGRVDDDASAGTVARLDRSNHRDHELASFVDSFLRRDDLAVIMHKMEVGGDLEVLRFFKGGSDAVTALVRDDGETRVRKVVPERYREKLAQQYRWLQSHSDTPSMVRALSQADGPGYYFFDIEFDPRMTTMFRYVHAAPAEAAERALLHVWNTLFDHVYDLRPEMRHPDALATYVRDRLTDRLGHAAQQHAELAAVLECDTVVIRGREYPNLHRLLADITANERAWTDLETYRESSSIHGDLTIDNLLIDQESGQVLIIDPSDDNQVRGPVLDFARHFQSLWGGYEFLNESDQRPDVRIDEAASRAEIGFESYRSASYHELSEWTECLAADRLTPSELRSLPFHVGLLYGRMLSHRVVIEPETALMYYARSVQFLHQFHAQYGPARLTAETRPAEQP
ncbi:lysylphosphatidylglycerol synthase transmembrane domain-containing protein [Leifsonia sp. McL0607]|uniref:lysylphosphatidylglycerol synthase transmembrane domain-containing protein n=1 Tax=Leifsonia sp. McL0607 TaxID=3415672 RepID=UPI003CF5EAC6